MSNNVRAKDTFNRRRSSTSEPRLFCPCPTEREMDRHFNVSGQQLARISCGTIRSSGNVFY